MTFNSEFSKGLAVVLDFSFILLALLPVMWYIEILGIDAG